MLLPLEIIHVLFDGVITSILSWLTEKKNQTVGPSNLYFDHFVNNLHLTEEL